jgi:hypothetical protein
MKNILVIADGETAKVYLSRVLDMAGSNKKFFVLYYQEKSLPKDISEQFMLYRFDPTSKVKLHALLESHEFHQIVVILSNKTDTLATYENIRSFDDRLKILLHDRWFLEFSDKNTTVVNAHDIVSNFLINHLPEIPLYATNIGLGQGEVAEFSIPFGSPFSYRYIKNIEQKRWKIVAIYREHRLILPNSKTILEPNDSILVVGNPHVLKSVYKSINREYGQFPIPFGENIYCFLDMAMMSDEDIEKLTNDSMLLHSSLNSNKLIFRVVNPRYGEILNKLKSYDTQNMQVELDFYTHEKSSLIISDVDRFEVGLFVTNQDFFNENLSLLYDLKIPILKVGKRGFFHIDEAVVMSEESEKIEKISSIIFDISSQLKLDISVYRFEESDKEESDRITEHFENLSKLFQEKIKIIDTRRNPIRELKERDNVLQFVPFDKAIKQNKIFALFSKNLNRLYFELSNNYQLFLPSED